MKRTALVLLAFFAIVALLWFVIPQGVDREDRDWLGSEHYFPSGGISAATEPACLAAGGEWRRAGCPLPLEYFECVTIYRDAGKKCSDGSECSSGVCDGDPPDPGVFSTLRARLFSATGHCARDNDSCHPCSPIINGVIHPGPVI